MSAYRKRKDDRRERLLEGIPESCGVYIFRNITGSIIYIGKAVNLRRRVMQYFARAERHEELKDSLGRYIEGVEWIPCETELHALLLEDELIKRYRPPYNVKLKKCLQYAYIGIGNAGFPEMTLLGPEAAGEFPGDVFGPYPDEFSAARAMDLVRKYLPVRGCTGGLPSSPCSRMEFDACRAPCRGGITELEYAEAIRKTKSFLSGEDSSILNVISRTMFELASGGEYERAARARDHLYYAGDLIMKTHFYRQFRNGLFMLNSKGRWQGTFLFRKGELVLYSARTLDEEDCRQFLEESRTPVSPAPDAVLYDRAWIVSSWSRQGGEDRSYRFLDAETA